MNPLLEHAARVLDHESTRSMHAEPLHRRAVRESGVDLPFTRFMDAVRERTDRFAVIVPDPVLGATRTWDPRQRALYEAALEAAGLVQPLIVLTGRQRDPTAVAPPEPATPAAILGDVHEALTNLLHNAEPGDPLHGAVTTAVDELHAIQRALHGITGGAA